MADGEQRAGHVLPLRTRTAKDKKGVHAVRIVPQEAEYRAESSAGSGARSPTASFVDSPRGTVLPRIGPEQSVMPGSSRNLATHYGVLLKGWGNVQIFSL